MPINAWIWTLTPSRRAAELSNKLLNCLTLRYYRLGDFLPFDRVLHSLGDGGCVKISLI